MSGIGLIIILSLGKPAQATFANEYIWPALAWILEAISSFLGQILLWVIDFLIQISSYNDFLNARVVSTGWSLTRDVANMFYILVMLIIAFGTMFKLEQYSWKKLLPRLILTAILVNFSKTIIGLFIDFAQFIMLTFVNGYAAAAGGNFTSMFNIKQLFTSTLTPPSETGTVSFNALLGFLLATLMLAVAVVVVGVFVLILLFRIVTLWILIVLSPIAFMLGTFPKGQEYYADWWKRLQNQIIVGPVIAFFLWLSLAALGGGDNQSQVGYKVGAAQGQVAGATKIDTSTEAGDWGALSSFAVSIAMLFIALQMTQQLGVVGAGLASGAAGWMKSKATAVAKKAAVGVAWKLPGRLTEAPRKGAWLGLSHVPFLKTFAAGRAGAIEAKREKRAEAKIKNIQYLPLEEKMRLAETWHPALATSKMAKSSMMEKMLSDPSFDARAREDWGAERTSNVLNKYEKLAGTDEKKKKQIFDFKKENPDLVYPIEDEKDAEGKVTKLGRKSIVQKIKTDDITKVSAAAFKDDEVVRAMNVTQRQRLLQKGNEEQIANYNETLGRIGAAGGGPAAGGLIPEQLVEAIAKNKVGPEEIAQVQLSDELLDKVVSDYPLEVGVKIAGVQPDAFNKRIKDIETQLEGALTAGRKDEEGLSSLRARRTSLADDPDLRDFGDYDKYQEMKGRRATLSAEELVDFRALDKRYAGFNAQQAGLDVKRQHHGELEANISRSALEQREMKDLEREINEGEGEGKRLEHARSIPKELSSVDRDIAAAQSRVEERKVAEKSNTEQLAKVKNVMVGATAKPQEAFKQLNYNPAADEGKGKFEGSAEQQKASQETLANVLKTLSEPPPWASNLKVEAVLKKLPDGKIAGLTELGRILVQKTPIERMSLIAQKALAAGNKDLATALLAAKKSEITQPNQKRRMDKKLDAPVFEEILEAVDSLEAEFKKTKP